MKIKTEELRLIVKAVMPAVKTDSLVEETAALCFDGTYLLSYNDKVAISYPFPENTGELSCGVSGKDFENALKGMRSKEVVLALLETAETTVLTITGGKTVIELPLMNSEKLIQLHDSLNLNAASDAMQPLPSDFLHGLRLTSGVTSKNLDHPQGLFTVSITGSTMLASDGFRVAKYTMADEITPNTFIVRDFVEEIIKFCPVLYAVKDSWIYFENIDGGIHCCRAADVQHLFPKNMEDMLKYDPKKMAFFTFPAELTDELEAMSFFSDGEDAREKVVEVNIDKLGQLSLKSTSIKGNVSTRASIEDYKGEDISFHVSPIFLRMLIAEDGKVGVDEKFIHLETGMYRQVVSLR